MVTPEAHSSKTNLRRPAQLLANLDMATPTQLSSPVSKFLSHLHFQLSSWIPAVMARIADFYLKMTISENCPFLQKDPIITPNS